MHAFRALVRKDLLLYLSNRRAMLMSLVAPIVIAAFFGSLFGSKESKPAHIPVAITDLDKSELSAKVLAALRADDAFELREVDETQALAQVRAGKARAAVTIPAGFGKQAPQALFGGAAKPEITLVYDPSQTMVLPMVRGMLAQHVMQPVSQSAFSGQGPVLRDLSAQIENNAAMPADQRAELSTMFDSIARVQRRSESAASAAGAASAATAPGVPGGLGMPFTTREVEATAQADSGPAAGYNSYAHSFAGMGVQFILLLGVDMGVALLTMRRLGLWKRLRAAPISRGQLLGSRIASTALIAFGVFVVLWAVAIAVFGVRILGSIVGFAAVLVAFALLTSSFGLMIAALGRTPEATRGLAILATLLLVMLGGAWVPSFVFPPWLQTVSAWVPTHWAIEGLDGMTWRGLGLAEAMLPVGILLAFTAAFSAIALWRFSWEE